MNAIAVMLVVLSGGGIASIHPAEQLSLPVYSRYEEAKAWAQFELGCRYGLKRDKQQFEDRYSRRMARVEAWFHKQYSAEELQTALPKDSIMVGGCRRKLNGQKLMPHERAFSKQLQAVEKRMRLGGDQ